jgi:RNA polymerase sigma-70 factor (ECF subfamily)
MATMPASLAPATPPDDDLALVASVVVRDREALETLMRRHNQRLFRTARAILRNDADAEDAVQDAYLRAFRAIETYRGEAKLSTWLVRIVVNESLGRRRKRERTAEVIRMDGTLDLDDVGDDDTPGVGGPEHAAMRGEARRMLETLIDALPSPYRVIFLLRAVEELPVDEVAAALDVPEATVRTRYFRARAMLRERLAREFDLRLEDVFAFAGERCDRIVAGVLARLDAAG